MNDLEVCPEWEFAQWLLGRPSRTYLDLTRVVEQHEHMLMIERSRAGSGIGQPSTGEYEADSFVSPQTPSRTSSAVGAEPKGNSAVGPRSRSLDQFIED